MAKKSVKKGFRFSVGPSVYGPTCGKGSRRVFALRAGHDREFPDVELDEQEALDFARFVLLNTDFKLVK